ncbi:carbohydrate kinase [Bacillus sp. FJAT-22090]|uniref:carbohydrate kinase family protein n=1 Tax=Bacillus sp. FJAT-22090 TaxID=1581038 RepID=UPI00119F128D|nr:carbohydrate kinase [Bacillus sp. FJAT-22090]
MNDLTNKSVLIYGDGFVDYIADDQNNNSFTKYLGGATVNVAAGIARLGAASSFITISGDDETSAFVRKELMAEGVDLSFALVVPEKRVSGVYVHLTENNDRHFHTYVDETPDIQVEFDSLKQEAFQQASSFHFCSGTLFHPTACRTTREIVSQMKKRNVFLSFDANIRPLRWESEELCRETICSFFKQVDILKLTEEELSFLTKTESREEGIKRLQHYQIPIVLITVGEEGTYAVIDGETVHVTVEKVEPVDTTGAGDAFMAGILSKIYWTGVPKTKEEWIEYISFGNKLGAICATKPGALSAMPRLADL